MDVTPEDEKYLNISSILSSDLSYISTPKHATDVSHNNPKKRKMPYCDIRSRTFNDLPKFTSSTPQESSTLNESLSKEFQNIKLAHNYFDVISNGPALKLLKTNGCEKLVTPPSTPESHIQAFKNSTPKKSILFQRTSSSCSVPSPLKEQHSILYPHLKPLEPFKKTLSSPQKTKPLWQNRNDQYCEYNNTEKKLLSSILSNEVVMNEVFKYLSDGDLFRVSMVSKSFKNALEENYRAYLRYGLYKERYKFNKENYKITPPSSPETSNLISEGSVSQTFIEFVETGKHLTASQSLIKCPKCCKPSIVEKSIAQCQNTFCGFIFCQKCDSFAYNCEEFVDQCQGLIFKNITVERKCSKLENLTNCSLEFNASSFLNSTSGYLSGYESSQISQLSSVKRNLSRSFSAESSANSIKPRRPLFDNNRSLNGSIKKEENKKTNSNAVELVKSNTGRKSIELIEPSSPPKVKFYAVCSRESRRSLKRLTR